MTPHSIVPRALGISWGERHGRAQPSRAWRVLALREGALLRLRQPQRQLAQRPLTLALKPVPVLGYLQKFQRLTLLPPSLWRFGLGRVGAMVRQLPPRNPRCCRTSDGAPAAAELRDPCQ